MTEKRVQEAQIALQAALEERNQSLTRVNEHHDPITRLPSRMYISQIRTPTTEEEGRWAIQPSVLPPNISTPLELGRICRSWRQVIQDQPSLWTSIIVVLTENTSLGKIDVLEQWLQRTGALPLNVVLRFEGPYNSKLEKDAFPQLVAPIIHLINGVLHRCETFCARLPITSIPQLRMSAGIPPIMRILCVEICTNSNRVLPQNLLHFGQRIAPQLLSIRKLLADTISYRWNNLTTFVGCFPTMVEAVSFFQHAHSLTVCDIEVLQNNDPPPATPFVHPGIKKFYLEESRGLFTQLTLPSLKVLRYTAKDQRAPFRNVLTPFINRCACPLKMVDLESIYIDEEEFIEFLRSTPTLQILQFRCPRLEGTLFRYLGATAYCSGSDSGRSTQFLPNMQVFDSTGKVTFAWSLVVDMAATRPPPGMVRRPLDMISVRNVRRFEMPRTIDRQDLLAFVRTSKDGVSFRLRDACTDGHQLISETDLLKAGLEQEGLRIDDE